jgi:hypothetical protein
MPSYFLGCRGSSPVVPLMRKPTGLTHTPCVWGGGPYLYSRGPTWVGQGGDYGQAGGAITKSRHTERGALECTTKPPLGALYTHIENTWGSPHPQRFFWCFHADALNVQPCIVGEAALTLNATNLFADECLIVGQGGN